MFGYFDQAWVIPWQVEFFRRKKKYICTIFLLWVLIVIKITFAKGKIFPVSRSWGINPRNFPFFNFLDACFYDLFNIWPIHFFLRKRKNSEKKKKFSLSFGLCPVKKKFLPSIPKIDPKIKILIEFWQNLAARTAFIFFCNRNVCNERR